MNGRVAKSLRHIAHLSHEIDLSYVQHRQHGQIKLKPGCTRWWYQQLKGNYYAKRKESAFTQ